MTYLPIFGSECQHCGTDPCVGLPNPAGIQNTYLCGPHFFQDRSMRDWELWNEAQEPTE